MKLQSWVRLKCYSGFNSRTGDAKIHITLAIYSISYWKCLLLHKPNTAQIKGLYFLNKKEAENSKLSLTIVKVQLRTQGLSISFNVLFCYYVTFRYVCNVGKKMFFLKLHELCRCF